LPPGFHRKRGKGFLRKRAEEAEADPPQFSIIISLTVRTDGSQRTFAPGHDVVIGRDLRASCTNACTRSMAEDVHRCRREDQRIPDLADYFDK
jgi:hypothetical protein